ncbi:MAG: hypothetical protein AAGA48_36170, partial [Myxococcota bacterium]
EEEVPTVPGGTTPTDGTAEGGPAYALSTLVFGPDQTSLYVMLIDSLDNPDVDLANAREFPGAADMWVHDGFVYVANGEDLTMTKFAVEDGELVEQDRIGFGASGATNVAFWNNTFVASDKAYLSLGVDGYVIWNPDAMEITGSIDLDAWNPPDNFVARHGFHDRSTALRDGKLYHPFYASDPSFFVQLQTSSIVVIDVETDTVEDIVDVPCPGLDFVTRDESDNLYFSSWVFAAGGAAVLDQPQTCISRLEAGSDAFDTWSSFRDLAGGLEGAALYYTGDGTGILAALDPTNVTKNGEDAAAVTFGANWRMWSVDFDNISASRIEDIDWNAGAHYSWPVDDGNIMLLAEGDFSATTAYQHSTELAQSPAELFEIQGWTIRIFDLP